MSGARGARRRLLFGLQTLLGVKRRGFFIPYRYADTLPPPGAIRPYGALELRFAEREASFRAFIGAMSDHAAALLAIGEQDAPPEPRWGQAWFPGLDAAAAYVMLRERKPRRVVEVGSGHSTRFLARARGDAGLETAITAIDPAPRADIESLPLTLIRRTVQDAGLEPFQALGPGDFLMIDSSHILMPGSDLDFLFGRVLPILDPGVILSFHDIFLPDDYPADWAWRGYNEQQGVMGLLTGGYEPLFSSHYVRTRMADTLEGTPLTNLPRPTGAPESGLWLIQGGALT